MVLQKPCKRQSYLYKENNMNLAITGSSGNIGGMVAQHLSTRDLPLILPLRNPAKVPDLPSCEARRFAYGDLELAKQALNRVDVLFMVSAAESPMREQEHLTLVQAASEAGVKHYCLSLVCSSGVGQYLHAGAHSCGYRKCNPANKYALHLSARQFLQ